MARTPDNSLYAVIAQSESQSIEVEGVNDILSLEWSPDGHAVAMVGHLFNNNLGLFTLHEAFDFYPMLLFSPLGGHRVIWSPDSTAIAHSRLIENSVYIYNLNTGDDSPINKNSPYRMHLH